MTTDKPDLFKNLGRADREMTALLEAIDENGGVECEQVPHVFYPEDFMNNRDSFRMAKLAEDTARQICMRCPVISQCLRVGLREEYGIWGGTTPSQRSKIRREQQI